MSGRRVTSQCRAVTHPAAARGGAPRSRVAVGPPLSPSPSSSLPGAPRLPEPAGAAAAAAVAAAASRRGASGGCGAAVSVGTGGMSRGAGERGRVGGGSVAEGGSEAIHEALEGESEEPH